MANLDEKLLDGPSVGYCSSSEDEDGPSSGFRPSGYGTSTTLSSSNAPQNGTPRTGPKGVLADYERHQRKQRTQHAEDENELLRFANLLTLETSKQPIEEVDELERIRQRRLEQMKSMAKGRIMEVPDRFEFLQLIEQQPPSSLLFMHIYADGNEQSQRLNEALLELAGRLCDSSSSKSNPIAKFYKVQTKVLGTSQKFSTDALPALQIYQAEQLIGNFIRLTGELGDDYDGQDLAKFLQRNGIPFH